MSTQVQYRRGTNAQNIAFTGALAEITVDTTNGTLRVHDGITAGGSNLATVSYVNAQVSSANTIVAGTSNVRVFSSGNVTTSVAGTANVLVVQSTGALITGDLSVTGNATLSGNILGDRIQNGTTLIDIESANGNANISVGGTSNIAVFANTGVYVSGLITATGNITGGNVSVGTGTVTVGNIVNSNGNGVGNIGSSSLYFNTVFAKATSAQYADLAEMYQADTDYAPGTVVEFGGDNEITVSTQSHSTRVAGIISTNPSYLMNATQAGNNVLPVALTGRVPCKIVGQITKGDRLVASDQPGVATALDKNLYEPGCIIGKALQDYNSNIIGIIEVAVGRF
jgi:hypothetical protein